MSNDLIDTRSPVERARDKFEDLLSPEMDEYVIGTAIEGPQRVLVFLDDDKIDDMPDDVLLPLHIDGVQFWYEYIKSPVLE